MISKTDISEIASYLVDASNYKGKCEEVIFPENENEIVEIIKRANRTKVAVTISGNGTGLTGGRVPDEGIVIATDKLDKILEINPNEKYAVVQTGVLLSDFKKEIEQKKLYYPPDPTEQNCFIGATVSTNASGSKTFKYGPTRDFVLAMKIVLPTGDTLTLDRGSIKASGHVIKFVSNEGASFEFNLPDYSMPAGKHAAGYFSAENMDLIDLFIGSEGTLGIITEIKLKLLTLPENTLSSVLFFDNESDALSFISAARKISYETREENNNGIDALGLEFFDKNSLEFLREDYPLIPSDTDAAVWFEQEINADNEEILFDKWVGLIEQYNCNIENAWFASNDFERKKFQNFRHAVSWKVNEFLSKTNIRKVGTDTAVPVESFNEYYHLAKKLVSESGLDFISYGHLGNCHLHLNMLPKNDKEFLAAKTLYARICSEAVKRKGTISAEHGIGKIKREYLLDMFGEENIIKMANLKKNIDPNMILSLGNIFDKKYLIK